MTQTDPITQALMARGAPFEVVEQSVRGRPVRVFKNAAATLSEKIDTARVHADAEFIVAGDRRLTYADYFAAVDNLSASLVAQHGISPGASVAICMKNSPEWMIGFAAILKAGGVAVLVNSRGTGETMAQAVADTDSVLVLADGQGETALRDAGCALPMLTGEDISAAPTAASVPHVERGPDDPAAMFFTSGTTGVAKAAVVSNRALVTGTMNSEMAITSVFQRMAAAYNTDVDTLRAQLPQSCSLLIFPLFHTSGCSSIFLTTLIGGGKLVLLERWNAEEAMRLVEREKVTILGGVPATLWDILDSPARSGFDLSSLTSISNGGQAFPGNLLDALRETFPKAYIGAGYGMTETAGSVSQAVGEALFSRPRASGTVLPMMDVRIVGDAGQDMQPGEAGEIWVRGATLLSEYYGRPDDTAASFSGEWFKTGDVGYLDADRYVYIVDRKTDMVISGGENIYCVEVEAALNKHPHVYQVTTFGVPDDRLGERLIACFVASDASLTPAKLQAFAAEHLAAYRVPKDFVRVDKPFALNAMSKIEKIDVRQHYLRGDYAGGMR